MHNQVKSTQKPFTNCRTFQVEIVSQLELPIQVSALQWFDSCPKNDGLNNLRTPMNPCDLNLLLT